MWRTLTSFLEMKQIILAPSNWKYFSLRATMLEHPVNIAFLLTATLTYKHKKTTWARIYISIFSLIKSV